MTVARHRHPGPRRCWPPSCCVGAARRRDTGEAVGVAVPRDASSATEPRPARRRRRRGRRRHGPRRRARPPRSSAASAATAVATGRRRRRRSPWVPPDPEAIGVTRRQFLNRVDRRRVGLRPRRPSASPASPSCGRRRPAASARRSASARFDDINQKIADGDGFAYYPEGRMWITEYPAVGARQGPSRCTPSPSSPAWRPASSRSTRSASTSAAACRSARPRSGSSARATARSTTRSARRRAARRRVASTASPPRSTGGALTVDTGTIIQGPPIGTNTTGQEAEGPALHQPAAASTRPPQDPTTSPCPSPPSRRSRPSTARSASSCSPSSLVATIVYVLVNVRFAGKAEVGSEIELAANRKPYLDDEELEGPKLDRALDRRPAHAVRPRRRPARSTG